MVDAGRPIGWRSLARACRNAGVTGIELGFPFSDPIADGPVLQTAATRALHHGTHWKDLLAALGVVSDELPTAVMTYANPVYHHGVSAACHDIAQAGGAGLIVPDLAFDESGPWQRAARDAGLCLVQMASPATSASRLHSLVKATSGFLYLVSRFGTTGRGVNAPSTELGPLVSRAHTDRPDMPVLVGFGVRRTRDLELVLAAGADGAVIGTAVEEVLSRSSSADKLGRILRPLVRALHTAPRAR
jgi:tryptophan synthase alpha chain